jgi:hypothetical protein
MKRTLLAASLVFLAVPAFAGSPLRGEYVEARTAEVFAGGCIMSSQAETMGKTAVLAWHVSQGTYDGQRLDGLSIVAAISGDRNLGIREIGGEAPSHIRAVVYVDDRATPAARRALVKMADELSHGLLSEVVAVKPTPVRFDSSLHAVDVAAGDAALSVTKHMHHDPSCGATRWFTPFTSLESPTMGVTEVLSYSGHELDTRWSDPHKRSSFYGEFTLTPQVGATN